MTDREAANAAFVDWSMSQAAAHVYAPVTPLIARLHAAFVAGHAAGRRSVNAELLAACEYALEANRKGTEPASWAVSRLQTAITNARAALEPKE